MPLSLFVCAALAPSAEAGIITVGTPLATGTVTPNGAEAMPYLITNARLSDPGAQVLSPVTGAIVAWHVRDSKGFGFQLYTLRPGTETTYTATGATAARTPLTTGLESFPASLPINAGEAIGMLVPAGAEPGLGENVGEVVAWQPPLAIGAAGAGSGMVHRPWAFNADIQPAPAISSLSATGGPAAGGTTVQISGTDFEGTTSVKFGPASAPFTMNSEGSLTATAPSGAAGSSVAVTVTTNAGTATASQQFAYLGAPAPAPVPVPISRPAPTCTVPNLKGKKLRAAKKKLVGADCKVGAVTKRKGSTAKTGKIVGQSKKPGTVLPGGAVVKVTLGRGG